jgi:endonuclease/exonuclease/phosphatase family metal-dependent hydrolase
MIIKLASYNVENLFDKYDDPLKNDGPPKKDRSIQALASVLSQSNADVVALQEVENKEILDHLLKVASLTDKYNVIVGKSDDRGIATALLINKKFKIKSYTINDSNSNFKRPPVEAVVEIMPNFQVKFFSVHLKSKRGGWESDVQRQKEANELVRMAKNSDLPTILMGDFNDLPNSSVINTMKSNGFRDVRNLDKLSKEVNYPTHFSNHISTLDYIFLSDNLKGKVVDGSFNVIGRNENKLADKASDHRLIEVQLQIQENIRKALG